MTPFRLRLPIASADRFSPLEQTIVVFEVLAPRSNRFRMSWPLGFFPVSAFLPPFARQALPRFSALTVALTSAGRSWERPLPADLPLSRLLSFPDILSPTTPIGIHCASVIAHSDCAPAFAVAQTSPVLSRLVAAIEAESCSLVITVCLIISVATHPASQRRSYFNFSSAQRLPTVEVSHLEREHRSAAH
jgi:hypothetical protein